MADKQKAFKNISPKVFFPELEEEILKYWERDRTFEKSVEIRSTEKQWTFLDGPPFITGLPHYGSLLSSIAKDVYPRYKTMKGYRVRRVWGWDCHGLPAENKVEKKLGLKTKREIEEKVGVKKFIDECKLYVSETSSEWKWYVDHVARWVDFKHAYKTMDKDYMETVMWVFRNMYDKDYIYKGLRVSLYCPHCQTPISNFEVAMDAADNYKDINESTTTYKYKLEDERKTYILAWSTTPWNKIATPALAINPKLTYVKVEQNNEYYILAESTLQTLGDKNSFKVVDKFPGSKLIGRKFEPHFDYYKDDIPEDKKAFEIIGADFVGADEGTGVVTIAAYGEEDLDVMRCNNVHVELHVHDDGIIDKKVPQFGGIYYLDVNEKVDEDLDKRGLIYKREKQTHRIPHCWRCGTRLFHNPQNAWYVDIQKLKPALKENNKAVNWVPKHFKFGRFLKSMEAAPDWCISRSRYWGSPVPVWECECGQRIVPGSISELENLSGKQISDLHKPEIDEVAVKCPKCGKNAKRVNEVLDSWIEAGSASFAERHFPFEPGQNEDDPSSFFPPDFIVEYTGQIRAWFYVLHVIATALYSSNAFKNVVVTGVTLGTDGRKMSKNYGNYPDPKEMIQKYGGDALRLYLMGSPVMKGEDVKISEEDYRNSVKGFLLPLWNIYNFFVTYANVDNWQPKVQKLNYSELVDPLDKWIYSKFSSLAIEVEDNYEKYDTQTLIENLRRFIVDDLSGWYIRRSRRRTGEDFYKTTFYILKNLAKIIAPITPFISEEIYRNLTGKESVHLENWPEIEKLTAEQEDLISQMKTIREAVEAGHALRKEQNIPVRQPLSKLTTTLKSDVPETNLHQYLLDELNIKAWEVKKGGEFTNELDTKITPELEAEAEARNIIRQIQAERKNLKTAMNEHVNATLPDWPEKYEQDIKDVALVSNLSQGEFKVVRIK